MIDKGWILKAKVEIDPMHWVDIRADSWANKLALKGLNYVPRSIKSNTYKPLS